MKTALTLLKEAAGILAGRGELDADTVVADFARQLRDAALPHNPLLSQKCLSLPQK